MSAPRTTRTQEGIAVFADHKTEIDAVLTDVAMPQMDGPTMIRALRRLNPGIKVIAMSGLMNADQRAKLKEEGIDANLAKPFTSENLLSVLTSVFEKNPGK